MVIKKNAADHTATSEPNVHIVLLHDGEGKVLALVPDDRLLNLVPIWRHAKRYLQPAKAADAERFFKQERLHTETGQQQLLALPLLLDTSLINTETIDIIEPWSGLHFRAYRDQYIDHAQVVKIGVEFAEIDQRQPEGDDETVISQAVERFTEMRIKQRLEETLGLPSFSPTTQKMLALRADPSAGVEHLVPVVKLDQSLAAQVMSWAVSPFYAAPGRIDSIDDAIIRVLGFDLVVNLALGISMGKTLALPEDMPRSAKPFWLQAVYTATLSEYLAKCMPSDIRPMPSLAYLTGLLHSFGYIILAHVFPPHFSLLSRYIEANPTIRLDYIEKHVLHVTREQIGAWLMECWHLPSEVCEGVRYLNQPDHPDASYFAKVVFIANRTLRAEGWADGPVEPVSETLLTACGLSKAQLDTAIEKMHDEAHALNALIETLSGQAQTGAG